MVTKNNFEKLSKKLCAYSAAAGAAVVVGGVADAAPQVFMLDTPVTTSRGQTMSGDRFDDTIASYFVIDPTDASATGLLGLTDNVSSTNAIPDSDLAGKLVGRYTVWEDNNNWAGKEGVAFGMITGTGNGVYATQSGNLFSSEVGGDGAKGFQIGDTIGDGDPLVSSASLSDDMWASTYYDNMPGGMVGVGLSGYGAGASLYSHDNFTNNEDRALGFTLDNRNGFLLINNRGSGARDQVTILGWGLESDPFVPITVTDVSSGGGGGGGAVPEPATLAMLAIGGAGLVALRRRRDR